jgi:hypothetical protein
MVETVLLLSDSTAARRSQWPCWADAGGELGRLPRGCAVVAHARRAASEARSPRAT